MTGRLAQLLRTTAVLALPAVALRLTSCVSHDLPVQPGGSKPEFEIQDAAHNLGNDHFFFLAPLVSQATFSGTFDASLWPVVQVCEWIEGACLLPVVAEFTPTTGPGSETVRVDATNELYVVNWHTDQVTLDVTRTYRIRVLVAGTELGHADVDLVDGGSELRDVNSGAYIPLVGGRTLPIKFRIEEGAVFVIGPGGGSITAAGGAVTLVVPPEALAADVGITIQPGKTFPSDPYVVNGTVFDFGPDGITFDQPVDLTIRYDPANVPEGVDESWLRLHTVVGDAWEEVPGSEVHATEKTVRGLITGFSHFAIGWPPLLVFPYPLDFGSVPVKASRELGLNVWNLRSTTVQLSEVIPFERSFDLVSELPLDVGPLAVATVQLRFSPLEGGTFRGPVRLRSSQGNGWGFVLGAAPVLEVAPASLDLGSVEPGNSTFGAFTVSNAGAGMLEGTATTSNPFAVVGGSPFSLGPGERTLVSVRFHPFIAGDFSGTVNFSWNETIIERRLLKGNTPPQLNVSPSAIDFGGVPLGSSDVRKFTVSNAGGGVLTGTAAATEPFAIVGGSPFNLQFGQSVDIEVSFTPSSDRQIHSGNVTFESNGGAVSLPVSGTGTTAPGVWTSVDAGGRHSCAIDATGRVFCWGSNEFGQLGGSTAESCSFAGVPFPCSTRPIPVATQLEFRIVSAAFGHSCGITLTGAAYCWGNNNFGQLRNGSITSATSPTPVSGELTFTSISPGGAAGGAAGGYTCGVTTDGIAYCWGQNVFGQLGDGSTVGSTTPVRVSGDLAFVSVSAGTQHTCGITTSGSAYCWGTGGSGQLGNGSTVFNSVTAVPVAGGLRFTAVSAGTAVSCGVADDANAYCWGFGQRGGIGDGSAVNRATPTAVSGGWMFRSVSVGDGFACGVTVAGAGYCWGSGAHGELGPGSGTESSSPVAVSAGLSFVSISAGGDHACGIATDGAAYCWGDATFGQLGDGTTSWGSPWPVRVLSPTLGP